MDAGGRATQEQLPSKNAGIVVLFRAFVIEEQAEVGMLNREIIACPFLTINSI